MAGSALQSALDDRFLETLLKIRRRDPSIYQAGAKLLGGSDEEDEDEDERAQKQKSGRAKKPVFLREVQAKQLLERDAAGQSSSDEDADEAAGAAARGPTYAEEQEQAKREFLAAVDGDEPPEDGLLVRKKGAPRAVAAMPKDESRAKVCSCAPVHARHQAQQSPQDASLKLAGLQNGKLRQKNAAQAAQRNQAQRQPQKATAQCLRPGEASDNQ